MIVAGLGLIAIFILNLFIGDESGLLLAGLLFWGVVILGPIAAIGGLLRKSEKVEHSKFALLVWRALLLFILGGTIYLILAITGVTSTLDY